MSVSLNQTEIYAKLLLFIIRSPMAGIILKRNENYRISAGHLWVFSNEIETIDGDAENGDIVSLFDFRKNYLGDGFYNKNSLISFRLLDKRQITDIYLVLKEKILAAYRLRCELYGENSSYRLVFSESDFLPGLIIDRYNSTFVLQVYSQGMEKNIESIVKILSEEFNAENIFSRNEEYFRKLEGLPAEDTIYKGRDTEEIISDGNVRFNVRFHGGQKTGFYFDQRDNRIFIEKICAGKSVADCFCNSGGFGLHALFAGAGNAVFVDSSEREIKTAEENYRLNGFTAPADFVASDVFDFLERSVQSGTIYDVVMIDPPAFAKNKKNIQSAKKGYEKLNRLALKCTRPGGYLVTSSCSYHLSEEEFRRIVTVAAAKNGDALQLIHFNNASLDHPSLPAMPETVYLKFAVYKKQ